MTKVEIPEKLSFFLTEDWRYKGAKGGRGSMKSWSAATALLIKGAEKQLRFLCAREIQKSIKESVHQLLRDRIQALNLERFYEITSNGIRGKNGTQFGFEGLRHNITNIKSWEGADIAWVEEAQVVSKNSWDILVPTIRKEGSEIWFTYNPDLEEDETNVRFAVNTPPNCKLVHINYTENPWLSETLRQEAEYMRVHDPVAYRHIWLGECRAAIEGAVFARELQRAHEEGRICKVDYVESVPVDVFADLGFSDQTALWFGQKIMFEHHWLNYYANSQEKVHHYIEYMKELPYVYGRIYLPHDAEHEQLGQERTIKAQFEAAFPNVEIIVVPRVSSKANSIEAARVIMANSYWDKEKCADGLTCLRRYAYAIDPDTGRISKNPEHNIYSHGADAFQTAGMAVTDYVNPSYSPVFETVFRGPRLG